MRRDRHRAEGAHSFAEILSPSFRVFDSMRRVDVATGTVKWFNSTKGYGFIQPDGGGKDVFVHISAVEKAGFSSLAEGAKVSYEIVSDRGKESAGNLRL
jgi:cold shock protein